jgi:hypothetical protein
MTIPGFIGSRLTGPTFWSRKESMGRWLTCVVVLFLAGQCRALEPSSLTADQVIEKLLQRSRSTPDRIAAQCHGCTRVSLIEERDSRGEIKERVSREFEVELHGARQQLRLLRLNDRPPTEKEAKRELEHEAEVRKDYSERKGRGRAKGPDFLDEGILLRYRYELVGMETNQGRASYVLSFEPKFKGSGKDIQDRALNLLAGRIWVDADEFELAGVDARLVDRLEVLAGIVGDLERLDFTLDRCRLEDGFWFNRTLKLRLDGRKLMSRFRVHSVIEQRDFKRLPQPVSTSEVPVAEPQRASR